MKIIALLLLVFVGLGQAEFSRDTKDLLWEIDNLEFHPYYQIIDIAVRQDLSVFDRTAEIENYWRKEFPGRELDQYRVMSLLLMARVKRIEGEFVRRYGKNAARCMAEFLKDRKIRNDRVKEESKKKFLDEKYGFKSI